ncbi:MAG: hypothetical protein GX605_12775 [Chloroflexi bacterium]|nr:hypothetical protein [Chloroflexota bacterium]
MTTQPRPPSKVLQGMAIALMALTVAFTLLGGAGTSCVAFAAEKFGSMAVLAPYKWLYGLFVVVSLAAGLAGIPATAGLVRGRPNAYRNALIVLLVGALSAGVQMAVSEALRGKSAPVNVRFYVSAFTLAVFLLLRLPPVWPRVDFLQRAQGGAGGQAAAAATALLVSGLLTLTTPYWAGPSHTMGGENLVYVLGLPLALAGWALTLGGVATLALAVGQGRRAARRLAQTALKA